MSGRSYSSGGTVDRLDDVGGHPVHRLTVLSFPSGRPQIEHLADSAMLLPASTTDPYPHAYRNRTMHPRLDRSGHAPALSAL